MYLKLLVFMSIFSLYIGPGDVLEVKRMSESDVTSGKQMFTIIVNMVHFKCTNKPCCKKLQNACSYKASY